MSEKETPIGMIPPDWDYSPIGSSIDLLTGPAFDSSRFVDDTSCIRLVRGINVTKGHLRWEPHITLRWPNVTPDLERYHLKAGDIVIGMDGSLVGRNFATITKEDTPSLLVQRVARLRTDHSLCSSFLYYFIASDFWISYVDVVKTHSGIPHISNGDIRNFKITFPPLPQQKKIARILTTVDNLIEKTEALIEKYKAIKQGMMHDLFTRGVDQNGKLRSSYEDAPDLYKESPLGWIPKEWEAAPLSQYAVVSGGVTLGRKHSDVSTVELPYLRVANVQDGYIDFTEIKTIEVLKSEVQRYTLEVGDILMTEGGDFDKLGRGTIWLGQISPCLHQNHIFRVRPNAESLDSYFLAAITSSAYGRHYFLMCAKQTTNLASINSTQVKAFPLLLPSLTEQKQIAERLRSIDSQVLSEQEQQEKVQLLKTGLMQDLLTGKVRVNVDEVEGILTNG